MDLGFVTLIVVIAFSSVGIAIGIGIAKFFSKSKEEADISLELTHNRVKVITEKIETLASKVKEKVELLREENIKELESEVKKLLDELRNLKQDITKVEVSTRAHETLDRIIKSLNEINYETPSSNQVLLTQIKDSFLIVRNDLEMILSKCKNLQKLQAPEFRESLDKAVELARKINRALVGSELLSLVATLKSDRREIVKMLDEQANNSKELVTVLETVRQQIGE